MCGVEITTWYLEQDDPALLRPAGLPATPVTITRAELPSPELNRYLYTAVGGDWFWSDRLPWTWQQWQDFLDRPGVETWVATVRGTRWLVQDSCSGTLTKVSKGVVTVRDLVKRKTIILRAPHSYRAKPRR